ncbi:Aste57867_9992 [Aphanomyces stellatus]|uniref:Aste57867_9992 protein n=1 Tax=Aphanomyces stellatus TaxID=120398 RepID=A0A485KPJ4_9STRA|nr:hypothetical protein As57867_009953 [Aphanomyces stellatus]VFT86870.1 Aste57867_9992 [Aphanomyces stellatus]
MSAAVRQVVQTIEVWAEITAYQDGWPQDLLPFLRLTKPRYFVRAPDEDSLFDATIAHNHSILSPWLAVHGTTRLVRVFGSMKRMVEIVVLDSVAHGNLVILAYLHDTFDLLSFDDRLLDLAAHFGHLETLQFLHRLGHPGCSKMAINDAALYGHLNVIQWLCEYREEGFSEAALFGACRNGHVGVLDWLDRQDGCLHRSPRPSDINQMLSEAAAKDHIDVLTWFRMHRPQLVDLSLVDILQAVVESNHEVVRRIQKDSDGQHAFETAFMRGDVPLVKKLHVQPGTASRLRILYNVDKAVLGVAAARGHVNVIQWWYNGGDTKSPLFPIVEYFGCIFSVGHSSVVDWLLVHGDAKNLVTAVQTLQSFQIARLVAHHPALLDMLHSGKVASVAVLAFKGQLADVLRYTNADAAIVDNTMQEAATSGHLACVKYLHLHHRATCALEHGVLSGRLDVVEYLSQSCNCALSSTEPVEDFLGRTDILAHLMDMSDGQLWCPLAAAALGFFEDAKLLATNYHDLWQCSPSTWDRICSFGDVRLVRLAIEHGTAVASNINVFAGAALTSLPILKYLVAAMRPDNPTTVFVEAASTGYLPTLRFLMDQFPTFCTVDVMDRAAKCGHLNVVQFLHDQRQGCAIAAMDGAAGNGHLDVVQWLHDHRDEGCSAQAMTTAAMHGHVAVVQWLAQHRSEGNVHDSLEQTDDENVQGYLRCVVFYGGSALIANIQRSGKIPYTRTRDDSEAWKLVSISAMPTNEDISVEEMRWHDYDSPSQGLEFQPKYTATFEPTTKHCPEFVALTAMPEYEMTSAEELRWVDYSRRLEG